MMTVKVITRFAYDAGVINRGTNVLKNSVDWHGIWGVTFPSPRQCSQGAAKLMPLKDSL